MKNRVMISSSIIVIYGKSISAFREQEKSQLKEEQVHDQYQYLRGLIE
jgi:hypothetical protein